MSESICAFPRNVFKIAAGLKLMDFTQKNRNFMSDLKDKDSWAAEPGGGTGARCSLTFLKTRKCAFFHWECAPF